MPVLPHLTEAWYGMYIIKLCSTIAAVVTQYRRLSEGRNMLNDYLPRTVQTIATFTWHQVGTVVQNLPSSGETDICPSNGRVDKCPAKDAPALVKKIGRTTYIVRVHFSKTSKETMRDKIKRMLKNEIQQM